MSKLLFPPKIVVATAILLAVVLVGCSHQKTQRGHLFRGDWAIEYNRTPWIGLPPDSGYLEPEEKAESRKIFACFTKANRCNSDKNRKGFRHHCAQNAECSAQDPCCRTLGCGMWIDSADPTTLATLGGAARACGLLPFCTPQRPCCLTPNCGRPVNVNVNPQTLMMANQNAGMPGRNVVSGVASSSAATMQGGIPGGMQGNMGTVRGMNPTGTTPNGMFPNGIIPHGMIPSGVLPSGTTPNGVMPGGTTTAVPGATLVSRGIVPGASAITSGGMVAAIGVATPAGTMTPVGVRLPNGMVSNAIVLRACMMTPNCTAVRPCCLTPHCGGAVAANMVANNATVLASALQAQGVASGVMQAGGMGMAGMGMLVNPVTNQPINGLTMSGYPQVGYPPIGYAPTGYAPGYPRLAVGMVDTGEVAEELPLEEEIVLPRETRSSMPVPRFHSIPTQPSFQRSEGMPSAPQTHAQPTAMTHRHAMSEMELESALDQAYLEGVAAAMDEVERKLEEKRQAVAKAQLQERILQQAEYVQQQLNAQEEMRILAMQRERQLRQQALRQAEMQTMAMQEPQRLPPPNTVALARPHPHANPASAIPAQLAENLKTSVVSGVNEIFAPLLGANQTPHNQLHQRGQAPAVPQPRQNAIPQPRPQLAAAQSELPGRPPVASVALNYGLASDGESESPIMQARFTDDGTPIRP